jgi:hypothetical protein
MKTEFQSKSNPRSPLARVKGPNRNSHARFLRERKGRVQNPERMRRQLVFKLTPHVDVLRAHAPHIIGRICRIVEGELAADFSIPPSPPRTKSAYIFVCVCVCVHFYIRLDFISFLHARIINAQ